MWQTKDETKFENVIWKMWWYEEDLRCIMKHHEFIEFMSADMNSLNSCQLIPTHYEKHQNITSWADERVEDEGCEMNNEWH